MSGEVYDHVGGVLKYWRERRMGLTPEEFTEQLYEQILAYEYPPGPYCDYGKLRRDEFNAEELLEWEEGRSIIEFYSLLIRDIATAMSIPTRRLLAAPEGK